MQATLCHQREKSYCFQCYGFTAGIWACNNHGIKLFAKPHRNRNDDLRINQGMAGVSQVNDPILIHNRRPGTHFIAQLCLGEYHIQPHKQPKIVVDILTVPGCFRRKLCKNPFNFLLFLDFQFPQGIIGIHRRHGLNKECRSGCRYIMHKSRQVVAALALNGNNIAALPNGDDRFTQVLGIRRRGNDFLQRIPNLSGLNPHMSSDIRQLRACIVRNFLFRQNCAKDSVFQVFICLQAMENRIQHRGCLIFRDVSLHRSCAAKHTCDTQKLCRLQAAASVSTFQRCADITHPTESGVSLLCTQKGSCCSLLQQRFHLFQAGAWKDMQTGFFRLFAASTFGKKLQNLVQFQFGKRFFI